MGDLFQNAIHANGSVVGASGASASGNQFVTPARTGAGVYTLTLTEPIDAAECVILATLRTGALNANIHVVHTSDTVKTVNTGLAAVATDEDFDYVIIRNGP